MKYLYPSILVLLFVQTAESQPRTVIRSQSGNPVQPNNPLSGCQSVQICLPPPSSAPFSQGQAVFNHFQVLDARPDTARIGLHREKSRANRSYYRQLVLAAPAAQEISQYLNNNTYTVAASPFGALIVLRNLWLSDATYTREQYLNNPAYRFDKFRLRVRAEVYAFRDSVYVPLFRLDTLAISRKDSYKWYGEALAAMLQVLQDSAAQLNEAKWASGRKLSFGEISGFNQDRFELPINRDEQLVAGVYANFEEFRNNAPSIQDFEVQTSEGKLLLYTRDAEGKHCYSHTAWGYCDGTNIFIMRDGELCASWRTGNAYYLFGNVPLGDILYVADRPQAMPLAGPALAGAPVTPQWQLAGLSTDALVNSIAHSVGRDQKRILAIDMDTGLQY